MGVLRRYFIALKRSSPPFWREILAQMKVFMLQEYFVYFKA